MSDDGQLHPHVLYAIGVAVRNVAADLDLPQQPADGDCLDWAPRMTQLLNDAGLPALTVTVIGWLHHGSSLIGWIHKATVIDAGVVVDCTARQFHPDFPVLWITTPYNYAEQLGTRTGVETVTFEPDSHTE